MYCTYIFCVLFVYLLLLFCSYFVVLCYFYCFVCTILGLLPPDKSLIAIIIIIIIIIIITTITIIITINFVGISVHRYVTDTPSRKNLASVIFIMT